MQHTVVFTPEALKHLAALYHYIGNRRDDNCPGLRITHYLHESPPTLV